jgi:glycerol uptake facilitator-like aquaporin
VSAGRATAAEFLGSALLLLAVTGSGIMGESLAAGNAAVALLANSLATAAALYVILSLLGPVSGAHLNPLVSLMEAFDGKLSPGRLMAYLGAQVGGALAGVWAVHLMFGQMVLQVATKPRAGGALLWSEFLATLLLLGLVRMASARGDVKLPAYVALTVLAGYWATASTFFANPAVTVARAWTDTFVGIRPADVLPFLGAQSLALVVIVLAARFLRR